MIDDVTATIERWRQGLAVRDATAMLSVWDRDYERLSYLATERPRFMTTWAEICAYTEHICRGALLKELPISELAVDLLGDDLAFAHGYITMVTEVAGAERRWNGRIQFVLRRTGGEWRVIHYEDSSDLAEAGGFVCRNQGQGRAEVADAIRSGDSALALRLLDELATPPPFSSAEAVDAAAARAASRAASA